MLLHSGQISLTREDGTEPDDRGLVTGFENQYSVVGSRNAPAFIFFKCSCLVLEDPSSVLFKLTIISWITEADSLGEDIPRNSATGDERTIKAGFNRALRAALRRVFIRNQGAARGDPSHVLRTNRAVLLPVPVYRFC